MRNNRSNKKEVMVKPFILPLVFLLSIGFSAQVRAGEILDWRDCVKEAKINNPDLISAGQQLLQSKADKFITQSDFLPQITSEAGGKKSKAAASSEQTNTYSYSLTGRQLLFDGFKIFNDINSAKEDVKAAVYNYAVVSSNVRLSLRTVFAQLLKSQHLIDLTLDILQRRKQNLKLVELRYEAGREHKGALLTAQADLAQAEFEVEQAKRNLDLAQTKLSKTIGWEERIAVRIEGDFTIDDSQGQMPDFESLADNTPFLKEVIANKEAARFDLKSAKADFFPQVYFDSSIGKSSSDWPPEDKAWSAGLSLSFPLFEGGSRIAQVSKQKAVLKENQAEVLSARHSVIITLQEEWVGLQDAIETVSVKKKYLDAAIERAKIANSQYSNGLVDFDDWIIIEDNLVDAKKSYLDAQADMLIAQAQWIQAKGGVLENVEE